MKNKSFTLQLKLQIVEYAEKYSISSAAKTFNCYRKSIQYWKKNKTTLEMEIAAGKKKNKRVTGAGRKLLSNDMENDLVGTIDAHRQNNYPISRNEILRRAKNKFHSYDDTDGKVFQGSKGWLQKFLHRNNLSLRRRTSHAQKDPAEMCQKIASYILYVSQIRKKFSIQPQNIIAMDETSVFFDMPAATTIARTGSRTVAIKTTGHEKNHVTVCLAAKGDGTKLKPFIVFKDGVREISKMKNDVAFAGVEVNQQKTGWMDTHLTLEWIDKIFRMPSSSETRLLAWDSFYCHFSPETIQHLKSFNTKMAVIPGGTTKYIQAPDVSWNKPFKSHMVDCYSKWISNEENMSETEFGNLRAPSKRLIVQWIMESWDKLSEEVIINSFKYCGLTTDTSGEEDDKIHCIKYGEPCRGAWDIIQKYRDEETQNNQEIQLFREGQEDSHMEIEIDGEDFEIFQNQKMIFSGNAVFNNSNGLVLYEDDDEEYSSFPLVNVSEEVDSDISD